MSLVAPRPAHRFSPSSAEGGIICGIKSPADYPIKEVIAQVVQAAREEGRTFRCLCGSVIIRATPTSDVRFLQQLWLLASYAYAPGMLFEIGRDGINRLPWRLQMCYDNIIWELHDDPNATRRTITSELAEWFTPNWAASYGLYALATPCLP